MNIDPIANLRMGDEIRHQSAHFMYRSCCDRMRIQILNCSQSCRNGKKQPRCCSNPSPNTVDTPVFRVKTRPGPQPGNPEPLLTLLWTAARTEFVVSVNTFANSLERFWTSAANSQTSSILSTSPSRCSYRPALMIRGCCQLWLSSVLTKSIGNSKLIWFQGCWR